jgi:hypothetical protein
MMTGSQYYTTARFAMRAQRMPVCGNLFHHAVEMLLKGRACTKTTALRLEGQHGPQPQEAMAGIQEEFPDPSLQRHDKTISGLDEFEDIRYPNPEKVPSMLVGAEWSGPTAALKTHGQLKAPKQYVLVVSPIDDLVADVFKVSSWPPASASFLGRTNDTGLEAITHHNAHSKFWTVR